MLSKSSLGKNVDSLRQDANKMIEDLGRLQADLVKEGKFKTATTASRIADLVETRVDQGVTAVTQQLETVADQVAKISAETKRQLIVADATLHKRPYSYYALGGAFAAGVLGGLILPLRKKMH